MNRDRDREQPAARLSAVLERLGGLIVDDERSAEIERSRAEASALATRQRRAERLDRELVPIDLRAREAILGDTLEPTSSLHAVQQWLRSSSAPPMLLLHGVAGAGKSTAAAWAVATHSGGARWRSALSAMSIFSGWFREAPLLVLDDLGRERVADAERMAAALLELVDTRQREGCRTLITTRILQADLPRRYLLEPLISRLQASSSSVTVAERDLRQRSGR
jgi:hypothetical protein